MSRYYSPGMLLFVCLLEQHIQFLYYGTVNSWILGLEDMLEVFQPSGYKETKAQRSSNLSIMPF